MPCEGFRFVNPCLDLIIYIIKEFVQPKMSFNNREIEREGVRERGGRQAGLFKLRLGLGEIEGRDRETEIQRDRET